MDDSTDAILATQTSRRGTCRGIVNPPNILRSSRSMEHRAPTDAQLQRFPSYKDENEGLQTLQEEQQSPSEPASPPPVEKKPLALKYANHLSGRELLADLHIRDTKEAMKNHIIMLNI